MANIKDVAQMANVSIATVSNVLNRTANVSTKTRRKVMQAIERLHFTPNLYAKKLRYGSCKTYALILSSLDNTTKRIALAIIDQAKDKGETINLYVSHNNRFLERKIINQLECTGIEGIYLQTCDDDNDEFLMNVMKKNIPIVLIDNYAKSLWDYSVTFNNGEIVEKELIEYLKINPLESESDLLFLSCGERYYNDIDVEIAIKKVVKSNYQKCVVSANENEAFYTIVQYFSKLERKPKFIISTKESNTNAVYRALEYYNETASVMYLANEEVHYRPNSIPLKREAYKLGITAYKTMGLIKAGREKNTTQTIVENAQIYNENISVTPNKDETLNLLLYDGPTSNALLPAIKIFSKTFGVKINYTLKNYNELYSELKKIKEIGNTDFDILMIDLPWFPIFNNSSFFCPLNEFINDDKDGWLNNFSNEIHKMYFYNYANIYSIPILSNMQFLFYRKDLFEDPEIKHNFFNKNGVELAPPKTWKDFEIVAKYFTKSINPDSPVKYGTTIQGTDHISLVEEFMPRQWYYGGKIIEANKQPVLVSNANIKTLESIQDILKCLPPQTGTLSWKDNFEMMMNDEIAMYSTFSTHIGLGTDPKFKLDFSNIAVAPVPGNYSMLGGYNLGVSTFSKHKKLAYQFIKWLCSGERAISNTILGCCIPHNKVFNDVGCQEMYPWLSFMKKGIFKAKEPEKYYDKNNNLIPPDVINDLLHKIVQEVINGVAPQEALENNNSKLIEIINGNY